MTPKEAANRLGELLAELSRDGLLVDGEMTFRREIGGPYSTIHARVDHVQRVQTGEADGS